MSGNRVSIKPPGTGHRQQKRRKRPRPGIKIYQIHCKACGKRYELSWTGEVKFCSFCSSDQISKAVRERRETPAERDERKRHETAMSIDAGMRLINGIFGFPMQAPPNGFHPTPPAGIQSDLETELLKEGYRKLATKYHPDKGGDPEKMKELNRLKDRLGL